MISIYQGKRQEGRRRYNCISGRPFFIWNTDDFYCIYRLPRQQAGKEDTVQDEQGEIYSLDQ